LFYLWPPKGSVRLRHISMEQQTVKVRLEMRKVGQAATIVEGIDGKRCRLWGSCNQTENALCLRRDFKNNAIILQGDHREKVKKVLTEYGFRRGCHRPGSSGFSVRFISPDLS